uniref:Uncharacterized protein n=1 Tax=Acrobeloides nanus TaxID=290746 RepID=A0A914DNU8_9BILA
MDKNTKQPKNLDEIYKSIKSYGYYQMFFLAVMQYSCWIEAGNRAIESLGLLIPTYKCFDKNLEFELNSTQIHLNASNACRLIRACQNLTLEKAWTSLHEEFEWFCESESLKSTLPSLLPFAGLLSFVIAGHVSDYLGRKWIIISGYSIQLLCGFLEALAPNMGVYMGIHVIKMFARNLSGGAAFVLAIESVHSKYRLIQAFGFQFSIGYMLAGLTCYLTGHWRRQLLLINFLGIPLLFIKLLKLEESPRFLIQKQKYAE